ncbi:chromate transporter [Methylocystis sp. IM3]|uniref:chromate transporter n=2 Tax=Methylocystis TaxID=133 RepID=UPI00405351FE
MKIEMTEAPFEIELELSYLVARFGSAHRTLGWSINRPGFGLVREVVWIEVGLPGLAEATKDHTVALISSFYRSGSLVFGGGHVVLPLLQQAVVARGWIGNDSFLAGYGAAQAVPGPLFTFAAYLGAAIKAASNGIRRRSGVNSALRGINATVVSILLAALYTPVWTSAIFGPADFGLGVLAFLLLVLWKTPPWLVGVLGAVGATAISNFPVRL